MKHFIIVKFIPSVTKEQKAAMLPEIKELFGNTLSVEGIESVNVYPNCVDRENRFDLMIEIGMKKEALPAYDACTWHKKWKELYGGIIDKKTIFDCE